MKFQSPYVDICTFSSQMEYVKNTKYCNHKKSLLFVEIHGFFRPRTQNKHFRLSVCLCVPSVDTLSFEGVCECKPNSVGVFKI